MNLATSIRAISLAALVVAAKPVRAAECEAAAPVNLVSMYGAANSFCNPPGDCRLAYPVPDAATRMEIERYAAAFVAKGHAVPARSRVTVCLPLGCSTYGLSDDGTWAFGEFVAQRTPAPAWPVTFQYGL